MPVSRMILQGGSVSMRPVPFASVCDNRSDRSRPISTSTNNSGGVATRCQTCEPS